MAHDIALALPQRLTQRRFYPWLVWGLGASFFFYEYIARVSPSVMAAQLMRDFSANATQLGSLSFFFYLAYLGLQMPVGMLVDRFGVRRLLTAMALLTAVGCVIFAQAQSLAMAEFGRFCIGLGAAFAFVSTLKIAVMWFPAKRVGLLSGLTQAIGMLGASVGEAPTALMIGVVGWRLTTWSMAAVFMLIALLIAIFVRDKQQTSMQRTHVPMSMLGRLGVVLKNPQTWLNATYAGLVFAPTAAIAELWGPLFLQQSYAISNTVAASAIGCIFLGWGLGGPVAGWVSDRIQKRKPLLIGSAVTGTVLMSCIIFMPHLPIQVLFVLLFLFGVSNTGVAIAYAVAAEVNPRSMSGTSLGFTNLASVIIGAACQPLIGRNKACRSAFPASDFAVVLSRGIRTTPCMLTLPSGVTKLKFCNLISGLLSKIAGHSGNKVNSNA